MTAKATHGTLTRALEDYLETIFRIMSSTPVARVRDIAHARDVRSASVTPALRRLSDMGLIDYARREYVTLTPTGEQEARRVYARHCVLTRFFSEVLQMPPDAAEREACAMEHTLSDDGMDRLVRFFEFLGACPDATPGFLEQFHQCSLVHDDVPPCPNPCPASNEKSRHLPRPRPSKTLFDLKPGEQGTVVQVNAHGGIRQRLLDMGILPQTRIRLDRVAPTGDPVWIELNGAQLALRRQEAETVVLEVS
ncbi:MAG: DtxR family transcriptional regulator [Deltaproteobacteria bacterium]|nr:DtxR family transcriptional regulator [Deltaproteobacteria bacterium]